MTMPSTRPMKICVVTPGSGTPGPALPERARWRIMRGRSLPSGDMSRPGMESVRGFIRGARSRRRVDDVLLLAVGELAVDRQRQRIGGGGFGDREVAGAMIRGTRSRPAGGTAR